MTYAQTRYLAADACPEAATDPGWLTQPVATIIAACIALIAASVAYLGVLRTTGEARRENRRAEKVGVLGDVHNAMQDYVRTIQQLVQEPLEKRLVIVPRLAPSRIDEIVAAVSVSFGKLYLYGFRDVTKPGAALLAQLKMAWDAVITDPSIDIPEAPIDQTYKAWLKAVTDAFDKLK